MSLFLMYWLAQDMFLLHQTQNAVSPNEKLMIQKESRRQKTIYDLVQVRAVKGKPRPDGAQVILVTITIADGWFIYANPCCEDIEVYKLLITVQGKIDPKRVSVNYPPGIVVIDPFIGKWKKYEGKVVVPVFIRQNPNDPAVKYPIKLTIQYCPNKDKICGPPLAKTLEVK